MGRQSRGKSNPRVVGSGELEQYSSGPQQELSDGAGSLDQLRQLYNCALQACILLHLPDCPVIFPLRRRKERVKGSGGSRAGWGKLDTSLLRPARPLDGDSNQPSASVTKCVRKPASRKFVCVSGFACFRIFDSQSLGPVGGLSWHSSPQQRVW